MLLINFIFKNFAGPPEEDCIYNGEENLKNAFFLHIIRDEDPDPVGSVDL